MKTTSLKYVLLAFVVGCLAGPVIRPLVVPQLSAQQMPTAQRWEGVCHDMQALSGSISVSTEVATRLVREMGTQGWEPSVWMGPHMCFKRPL